MAQRRPTGEKTKRLNVYLLKSNVTTFADALEKPAQWQGKGLALKIAGFDSMLYAHSKSGKKADWVAMLEAGVTASQQQTPFTNASSWHHSALLVIRVKRATFAIVFGYGNTFLKRDCWEPRFGLKVALNLAEESNLQQAAFKTHEGKTMSREISSSRLTSFYDFGFDSEKDFLRKLTAKLKKGHGLGLRVTGKDSVSLVCPAKLDELPKKCRTLRYLSRKHGYKKAFPDIENVVPVDDRNLIGTLTQQLDNELSDQNSNAVHFALPDVIDYERYAGVKIGHSDTVVDDLSISSIEAELGIVPLTSSVLEKERVRAVDDQDNVITDPFLSKCCIAEISYGGKTYLFTEGQWLECDASYIAKLDAFVNMVPVSNHLAAVPRNGIALEDPYLQGLSGQNTHGFLVAHKKNVMYGGGQNKLEMCDLLRVENGKHLLIHVKGGGGANAFGHLVHQGLNSLELLIDDDNDFNSKSIQRLQAAATQNAYQLPAAWPKNASDYKMVYAVFQDSPPVLASTGITLFGKISLRRAVKTLRKYGCEVALEWLFP